MIAGIETGGTKILCAVAPADDPGHPTDVRRIPTTSPFATLDAIDRFLTEIETVRGLDAIGIAAFGPVNVEPDLPRYGWVTGTSKPGWADTDLLGGIRATSRTPTVLMSDVSGAALGEHRFGAARGTRSSAYATFGTGVGAGLVVDGAVLHGNGFPELGHLLVRRHPLDDFAGVCPFHGDCVEGLASGPAVLARWGVDASHLPPEVEARAFTILGFYLSQVAAAIAFTNGVERVILGGGVTKAPGLLEETRRRLIEVTGGPHAGHSISADPTDFLVSPALGDLSGVLGALAAASDQIPSRPTMTAASVA